MKSHFVYCSNDLTNCVFNWCFFYLICFSNFSFSAFVYNQCFSVLFKTKFISYFVYIPTNFKVICSYFISSFCAVLCWAELSCAVTYNQLGAHKWISMWQLLQCIFINKMNALTPSTCVCLSLSLFFSLSHSYTLFPSDLLKTKYFFFKNKKKKIRDTFKNTLATIKLKRPIIQSNDFAESRVPTIKIYLKHIEGKMPHKDFHRPVLCCCCCCWSWRGHGWWLCGLLMLKRNNCNYSKHEVSTSTFHCLPFLSTQCYINRKLLDSLNISLFSSGSSWEINWQLQHFWSLFSAANKGKKKH